MFVGWINLLIINYLNGRYLTLAKSEALLISKTPPGPSPQERAPTGKPGVWYFSKTPPSPLNLKRGSTSPPKSSPPQKRRT